MTIISRDGRPVAGFAVGTPPPIGVGGQGTLATAADIGYVAVGLGVVGLAVYGGWVLWKRR
jgi:hypothetical protein